MMSRYEPELELAKIDTDTSVIVYGASDDLVEMSGVITDEFSPSWCHPSGTLSFPNGVVLDIRYNNLGIWRINVVHGEDLCEHLHSAPDEETEADVYTDVVAVHGVGKGGWPTWADCLAGEDEVQP